MLFKRRARTYCHIWQTRLLIIFPVFEGSCDVVFSCRSRPPTTCCVNQRTARKGFSPTLTCDFRPLVVIFGDLRVMSDGFCEVITGKKHSRGNKIDHGCPCGTEFTLGWTPFPTDAYNGFSMSSNLVYTSVMITPESLNFKVTGQIPDSSFKTRLWYWSLFAYPDHTFQVNKWNAHCSVVWHEFRFSSRFNNLDCFWHQGYDSIN